jgi:hypothetical protein
MSVSIDLPHSGMAIAVMPIVATAALLPPFTIQQVLGAIPGTR